MSLQRHRFALAMAFGAIALLPKADSPHLATFTNRLAGSNEVPPTASQAADLLAGRWYVNLHTTKFPAGEIRGQLIERK